MIRKRELREVQEHFRLPSIGLVEKDLYVVRLQHLCFPPWRRLSFRSLRKNLSWCLNSSFSLIMLKYRSPATRDEVTIIAFAPSALSPSFTTSFLIPPRSCRA
jgi:hypothetical protein